MVARKILIRADSSTQLGYGHVYRCLTLADELKTKGAQVDFMVQDLPGNINAMISQKGYKVYLLKQQAKDFDVKIDLDQTVSLIRDSNVSYDWVIVDHYSLDERWEKALYTLGIKVFVIDDLAAHNHFCHYLLNQTFNVDKSSYDGKINKEASLLMGEKYILLRPEFSHMKPKVQIKEISSSSTIHIFWGSTDPKGYSYRFSKILLENFKDLKLKIIGGAKDTKVASLEALYPNRVSVQSMVQNMAQSMLNCDLALGAPGMTTWERASMGLPGIYLATNTNQVSILNRLQEQGFCCYLGEASTIDDETFVHKISSLLYEPAKLKKMAQLGFEKIDALGVQRVTDMMMEA
ncbi:MAG: UDP-2,4-diacetamido-2,4,6-trideoxy-beta-L-altropyranose hydrolase [Proteobacteria bacterium]|nr:UDP-2,4-diacetamido-2,4,6-trideoxy-beta-L-altropyranose hydrolase [Pseudomonadota bacterium]